MKITSTVLTLLVTVCFFLPTKKLSAQHRYRISNSVDLVIGGDLGFRLISENGSSQEASNFYNNRDAFETFKLNYRIGLNYLYGVSKNISVKTGIRMSNPGFSITDAQKFDFNQDINTVEKQIINSSDAAEFRYNYQLIEIPLGIRYTLSNSVCEPFFEVGIAGNIYWKTIVKEKGPGRGFSTTAVNEAINNLNYVGFISMGGNFKISEEISGFTQMIGRYQLNNLRKGPLTERIISLGIEMGIKRYI